MIAQGRSAIVDGAQQHLLDGSDQAVSAFALDRVSRPTRRDAGQEQGLAGVYIADPNQGLLIEQGGLDGSASSLETLGQRGPVEGIVERFGPQALEELVLGQRLVGGQQHQTEAARVVETDLPAFLGFDHDMIVPLERMFGSTCRIVQGHATRHAEMGDQGVTVIEAEQQVFRPAVDAQHPTALDSSAQSGLAGAPAGRAGAGRGERCAVRPVSERGHDGRFLPREARACRRAAYAPRWPNRAVPTRTWVAPRRMAFS